jgi:hypothetical protein
VPRTFYAGLLALTVAICAMVSPRAAGDNVEGALSGTFTDWSRHPAIVYSGQLNTSDPVARVSQQIRDGRLSLRREGPSGYLRSVLDALKVPLESQIVIFNPDSVQARRISAGNPRSLFFNDQVAVGWVRGGFIELASQDPSQGVIFYTLQEALVGQPYFVRRDDCLSCHYSFDSAGVPGMLARSTQQFHVTHRLPLEKRWGGWYVTGNTGAARHRGNIDLSRVFDEVTPAGTTNWPSLEGKFDLDGYLTPHSDVVALMVFEHQMHMMNLLSRIGWEARVAEYRRARSADALRAAGDDGRDPPVPLDEAAREVVDYMLFVDEPPLPNPIRGSTAFAERFAASGPRDPKGRSLRDFDLSTRMFRHPLSYMIDSPQFDALPASARNAIYARLWNVLSGKDRSKEYARLTAADRGAIVEILRATRPGLPDYFIIQPSMSRPLAAIQLPRTRTAMRLHE